MFNITLNKGFHVTFSNGWTASVQWGGGNYCANRWRLVEGPVPASKTAEIACWRGDGVLVDIWGEGDTVKGFVDAEEVVKFLFTVSQFKD